MASMSRPVSRSVRRHRLDDRAEAGLRGVAGEAVHGGVDRVDPGARGGEDAAGGDAAGVVGVEVDGEADLLLQRLDQREGGRGLEEPGHVLEAEDVGAGVAQLLAHGDVVFQVVLGAGGVEDVAGVADRRLADLAGRR